MPAAPVALVTGASRGVGKGVVTALHDAGYTVFATGRSIDSSALPSGVVRVRCDHTNDADTDATFERIRARTPRLDVLVNNAWGGYERMIEDGRFTWGVPFWRQPAHRWTGMIDAGVRAAWAVSSRAVPMMLSTELSAEPGPNGRGLIVNISAWAAQKFIGNTIYGVSKAATDKLTADMAHELRPHGVAVLSLYPGLVRTESVLAAVSRGWFTLDNSESPEFIGRVIASRRTRSAAARTKRHGRRRRAGGPRTRRERHRRQTAVGAHARHRVGDWAVARLTPLCSGATSGRGNGKNPAPARRRRSLTKGAPGRQQRELGSGGVL